MHPNYTISSKDTEDLKSMVGKFDQIETDLISVLICTHLISLHYLRITPIKFLSYVLEFIVILFMTKFVIT